MDSVQELRVRYSSDMLRLGASPSFFAIPPEALHALVGVTGRVPDPFKTVLPPNPPSVPSLDYFVG